MAEQAILSPIKLASTMDRKKGAQVKFDDTSPKNRRTGVIHSGSIGLQRDSLVTKRFEFNRLKQEYEKGKLSQSEKKIMNLKEADI